jgi:hypothetical protein
VSSLIVIPAVVLAQESESVPVGFDPRETGEATTADYVLLFTLSLVIAAAWWLVVRFITRFRELIPWRRLSYVWPSAGSALWVLLILVLPRVNRVPDVVLAAIVFLYGLLFLPSAIGAALVTANVPDAMSRLSSGVVGAIAGWVLGYATVRYLESRAWRDVRISLDLRGPNQR